MDCTKKTLLQAYDCWLNLSSAGLEYLCSCTILEIIASEYLLLIVVKL